MKKMEHFEAILGHIFLTFLSLHLFFAGGKICSTYTYGVRAVVQCIPAWLRFVQCLRRYRDTKRAFPHLVNAGKYSTTFFMVTFAALYSTHKGIGTLFLGIVDDMSLWVCRDELHHGIWLKFCLIQIS